MPDDTQAASARADLTATTADELAEALCYALRYDERGKPHSGGGDLIATIAAERLAEHLRHAGFLVMKGVAGSRAQHRLKRCGMTAVDRSTSSDRNQHRS